VAAAHGSHGAAVEFVGTGQVLDGQGFHDDFPSVNKMK
jgi:hypothetical protein